CNAVVRRGGMIGVGVGAVDAAGRRHRRADLPLRAQDPALGVVVEVLREIHGRPYPAPAHAVVAGRHAGTGAAVVAHRSLVLRHAVDARAVQARRVLGAYAAVIAGLAVVAGHRAAALGHLVAARDVAAPGRRAGVRRAGAHAGHAVIADGAEEPVVAG